MVPVWGVKMVKESYTPRGETAMILDQPYAFVQSVPDQVSLRWLYAWLSVRRQRRGVCLMWEWMSLTKKSRSGRGEK